MHTRAGAARTAPKPTSRRRAKPSLGRPDPSQADIALTQDIKKAAAPIGLVLHDHLIIRGNSHTSVRDLKLI
jgi:DNA repair protein RadC